MWALFHFQGFNVFNFDSSMEIPKNEGAIHNKGRAFIEYNTIKEAKNV